MQPKRAAWRRCDNGAERRKLPSVARGGSASSTPPLLMLATVDESAKVTRAARPASSAEPALQVAIAPRSADTTTTTSARARRAAGALSRHAARRVRMRQAIGTSRRRKVHHARKPDSLAERDCCCRRQRHDGCRLGRGHRRQSRFVFCVRCDLYRLPFCARVCVC